MGISNNNVKVHAEFRHMMVGHAGTMVFRLEAEFVITGLVGTEREPTIRLSSRRDKWVISFHVLN